MNEDGKHMHVHRMMMNVVLFLLVIFIFLLVDGMVMGVGVCGVFILNL